MHEDAASALKAADPVLAALIDRIGPIDLGPPRPPFASLCRGIIFQQLSGRAAMAIMRRLQDLYAGEFPTPPQILATAEGDLRRVGISERKVEYLKGLAAACLDGAIEEDELTKLPNEEVVARLMQLRGIGRWSAEMFLLFCLRRADVLPATDLSFRKALRDLYNFPALPTAEEVRSLARRWEPHWSMATLYIWRSRWRGPQTQTSDEGRPKKPPVR